MSQTTMSAAVVTPELQERRRAKIRAMMAREGLDALIVWSLGPNLNTHAEYLAGQLTSNAVVWMTATGDPVAFVQPKAVVPFIARVASCEVRNGGVDYNEVLCGEIEAAGLQRGRIGLVEIDSHRSRGIPHLLYLALRERFPDAQFPTATEDFEYERWQLEPQEVAWAERAALDLDQVMDFWVSQLRPGTSPAQAVAATKEFAATNGLALSALSGRGTAMVGGNIQDPEGVSRPLRQGDYVFFESNARIGGMTAYRGFPVCLGEPTGQAKVLFDTTEEIAKAAAERLRPGGRTSEIIALGSIVEARGLASHGPLTMGMGTGGWQLVCEPRFEGGYRPAREVTFAPGMLFTASPHLCTEDWSLVTIIGNSVLVTAEGPRILGKQGIGYRVID